MTITTTGLTRAAGIAAAVAGSIFIAVQINHPGFDTYLTDTHEWVLRCFAKAVMCVLALAGITGIFLHQARQLRVLGLVGFLVFAFGYLMMLVTEVMAVVLLPSLTDKTPEFVNNVVMASGGAHPSGIGHFQDFLNVTGACYLLGGLLFGIALFRSGVLARWAAVLLAVSTVGTAALAMLPPSFDRPMAVPEGVALIGLGLSLWRTQRTAAPTAAVVFSGTPESAVSR